MTTRINQLTIAGLSPTGSTQFVRDSSLQGFGIKVTPTGKATYFAEKRVRGGRVVRKKIGDVDLLSLDDARIKAREILLQLSQGVDVARLPPPAPTVETSLQAVFDRYIAMRVNLAESTKSDYRKILNNCFDDWKPLEVDRITKEMVAERYRKLKDAGKSDAYIKKALRSLKAILNSSGLALNPVALFLSQSGVTTTPTVRERFLRHHEIQRIMELTTKGDGTPDLFVELIFFYLLTGARKNEALNLKKTDYSAENGTLVFKDTKNHKDHRIPTYGLIKGIVERAIEASGSDKIFDYGESTYRTKLDKFRDYVAFDSSWTTHDLRRTVAEHCELAGVDVGSIGTALNHSPTGVTQRHYARGELAKLDTLRGVYEKLQRQYRGYVVDMPDIRYQEGWDDPT
ncbi:integrase family protein [Aestuariivita boseongensis]|uniref:integrase family protein n=1 Tax=Aestuariivita boseongensis TaxID=1470562 RepID=UPI00067FC336|nr:integrase family protein [Aestuariivita boseongensis]